jgi:hypothetical protein
VRFVRERLAAEAAEIELAAALGRHGHPKDARAEWERILRDLFRRMVKNRRALKLIDRCAVDHPDLAAVWFGEGRWGQVALLKAYLDRRVAERAMREMPNTELAARTVLETIALWAIHMLWDPSPRPFGDEVAEDVVVDMLVHAYCKESRR